MSNWGKGTTNNSIGWGKGADNNGIGWGSVYAVSNSAQTDIQSGLSSTVAPAISGTNEVGETLSCTSGTWSGGTPITYAYQWRRDGVNIGSATNATYLLISADAETDITCVVTATNAEGSNSATSNTVTIASEMDADAQAFITAASITDPTQQSALSTFYETLKADGIYTKMKAMYFPVTGSASTSKFNMVNPVDSDAAFRLSFSGGWTFSTGSGAGADPNGATAYADTFLIPSSHLSTTNTHLSFFSLENTSVAGYPICIGAYDSASSSLRMLIKNGDGVFVAEAYSSTQRILVNIPNSVGFYGTSRRSDTDLEGYKNGSSVLTNLNNQGSVSLPTSSVYISAQNSGGSANAYDANKWFFASIGDGLTDTEWTNLTNAVNTLRTSFGINV